MTRRDPVIDVNAWLGAWPFRYVREETAGQLAGLMHEEGIDAAFVCSAEAPFTMDVDGANERLRARLAGQDRLVPVPALDPLLATWRDRLARLRDEGTPAVRLFPVFHGFEMDDPAVLRFVEELARAPRPVLTVQARMEDKRTQHPLAVVPGASIDAVVSLSRRFPGLPVLVLCAYRSEAERLGAEAPDVLVDLSHVESMRTVSSLLPHVPAERILLGTHAPFLTARSALMKARAADVPPVAAAAILGGNARRLFGPGPGLDTGSRRR